MLEEARGRGKGGEGNILKKKQKKGHMGIDSGEAMRRRVEARE